MSFDFSKYKHLSVLSESSAQNISDHIKHARDINSNRENICLFDFKLVTPEISERKRQLGIYSYYELDELMAEYMGDDHE